MIFKRKSFHTFKNTGEEVISSEELAAIEEAYLACKPLVDDIKTAIKIVPADKTTCKRGQEYCILLYSEKKGNYRQNIGYIGEQLYFVIMIAIKKVPEDRFRKDMYKSKSKLLADV